MCCGACGFGFMPIGCMWGGAQGNLWVRHVCLLESRSVQSRRPRRSRTQNGLPDSAATQPSAGYR